MGAAWGSGAQRQPLRGIIGHKASILLTGFGLAPHSLEEYSYDQVFKKGGDHVA